MEKAGIMAAVQDSFTCPQNQGSVTKTRYDIMIVELANVLDSVLSLVCYFHYNFHGRLINFDF